MKLMKVLCVIALVFAVSAIAYAETQSVKVSGDITLRSFLRNNYDLDASDADNSNTGLQTNNWASYLTSTAEVQIDADLTDNVSGVVRLVNQRVWGDGLQTGQAAGELGMIDDINDVVVARGATPGQTDAYSVLVDLAYVELKEFLYSPLTLRIGRQDLWFGKGFIIGANMQDPSGGFWPMEYTAVKSFDAIRATLDYDPWTIDGVFAKISENARRADDDINLWGLNVGYVFDNYNGEAEAYWFFKQDRNPSTVANTVMNTSTVNDVYNDDVHTFGLRGSFDPIEDWTIALEGAYQTGDFLGIAGQQSERDRSAWAIDAMVECRYWQDDFAWRPVVSAEYIFYSGQEDVGNRNAVTTGDYNGWDSMYRGKFDTAIREFQNVFYRTATASTPSHTNQHQVLGRLTLEPTDSLTFEALYGHFWLAEDYSNQNTDKNVGDEVDLSLTWDYTEDVTFGLLSAWFFPGDALENNNGTDDVATDIVGTVALSF
ncbi:MAG: hypothetical protein GF408_02555 [Candidatus Omnitrophica bacterium]|nr:hypothetical protein [Candidatus Omnitrophota bacterium]